MSAAKFSLSLTHPTSPSRELFPPSLVRPIRAKMDVASNPVLKSFLAGSFSGTCSTILFQPLDLVKTRLQQAAANNNNKSSNNNGGVVSLVRPRQSMYGIMRGVLATDSLAGLWRGITPSITRTVPGVGLYFSTLHWLKTQRGPEAGPPSPLEAVALGMAARCVAGAAMIPITVIKTRFESGAYDYARMTQALSSIYRTEGARGLVRGLVPTLARDAPYSGLYLMFYTQLKQRVEPSPQAHFACGVVAGFAASAVTHPADVVKTKMQVYPADYGTVAKAAGRIWAEAGASGFLVGLAPRMLRRTLMSALAWTVYEEIMRKAGLK